MKLKNIKVFTLALSGVLSMTQLTGCSNYNRNNDYDYNCDVQEKTISESTKQFGIGEHTISIPIKVDVTEGNVQYAYHEGYEPVGISIMTYGSFSPVFAGGVIMYSNVDEVECKTTQVDENGNYVYVDFGTSLNDNQKEYTSDDEIKEFGIGEHIISVPLNKKVSDANAQYLYQDGYEIVGITMASFGEFSPIYAGGAVLYKNVVPVKCSLNEAGYTSFGTPQEQVKGLK